MRKRDIKHNYLVGSISIGLLSLVAMALLCPSVDRTSYAVDCAPGEEPCTTTQAEAGIDLTVASTVSVALQNLISLEVTPKTSGAFTESTAKLTVATNNPSGYAVYMQAGSTTNGKASLVSSDLSNTAMINPVSGTVENNSFSANTWGYSLDGTHYQAVPATTGIIKETSSTTFSDTYDLSFGVNVDTNLPAGQYTNSVIVSAVANPIKVTSLSQLNYMQDMTTDICTNTAEHVTKQLIDTRDGKPYWVAKLKDGNCWMTQNLALDLSTSKTLTPADTDVEQDWTPSSNTNAEKLVGVEGEVSLKSEYSWNFGEVVLALPTKYTICDYYTAADSAVSGDDLGVVCRESGAVNVSGAEWQPIFKSQSGTFNGEHYDYVAVDEMSKTYDAHYLIGNYYQYNTVTAGSGSGLSMLNQSADDSICPKGWRLPTSGVSASGGPIVNPNEPTGSFYQLLMAYGYDVDNFRDASDAIELTSLGLDDERNVVTAPIYFVRSGIISLKYGYLRQLGSHGYVVSDATYNAGHDLFLAFAGNITPIGHDNKHYGYSVRCLAR